MDDNVVDKTGQTSYNDSTTDDIYEHVVKMDEQKPINDVTCRHDSLVADPEDTMGEAIYHGCTNSKCGVGFYIQPTKNKNIT